MQTTTRRFNFGIVCAATSCPLLSRRFRVFGDIATNNGARDLAKQRHARCGRLAERNQSRKGWDFSSHHHKSPREGTNAAISKASVLGTARHRSLGGRCAESIGRDPPAKQIGQPSGSAVHSIGGERGDKFVG